MTLKEWADGWPNVVTFDPKGGRGASTPDSAHPHDQAWRVRAFHLDDYVVAAVSAGTVWFWSREREYTVEHVADVLQRAFSVIRESPGADEHGELLYELKVLSDALAFMSQMGNPVIVRGR